MAVIIIATSDIAMYKAKFITAFWQIILLLLQIIRYLILCFVHTNDEYQLCYDEADAQVDVNVVSHAPQSPRV